MTLREENGELVADQSLYATRDGRLVAENDPEANVLVAAAGVPIRPKLVQLYGLKPTGKAPAPVAVEISEPEEAEQQPPLPLKATGRKKNG